MRQVRWLAIENEQVLVDDDALAELCQLVQIDAPEGFHVERLEAIAAVHLKEGSCG